MKAENIEDAIAFFDPHLPLHRGSEFYVGRERNPRLEVKSFLLRAGRAVKILFTGFKGSGKSTELNYLAGDEEIEEKFLLINFSVKKILNLTSIDYIDLLFVMAEQIYDTAVSIPGVEIDKNSLELLKRWGQKVETEEKFSSKADVEAKTWISSFFASVTARLKMGYSKDTTLKQELKPRMTELWNRLNDIIRDVRVQTGKNLLIIIDDLNKADIDVAEELFYIYGHNLTIPKCHILFTIPISLVYSENFPNIERNFDKTWILPGFKIYERESQERCEHNFEKMKEIIRLRMDVDKLTDEPNEIMNILVHYSGGFVRELIILTQNALNKAAAFGERKICIADVDEAVHDAKNTFINTTYIRENIEYLLSVEETKTIVTKDEEITRKLLHNLSILQYKNCENWFDVNPLLKDFIHEVSAEEKDIEKP
ncbi:MAG: hypothetical protein K8T10_19895 [Candidatus Eremiobacteraeota bacterium]|nr:hypothetical protein [Candidatus Eremiobacteraeota bacterium]